MVTHLGSRVAPLNSSLLYGSKNQLPVLFGSEAGTWAVQLTAQLSNSAKASVGKHVCGHIAN